MSSTSGNPWPSEEGDSKKGNSAEAGTDRDTHDFVSHLERASRFLPPICRPILRNEADVLDAVQDTILKILNRRKEFASFPDGVRDAMAITIARRTCLDRLRKNKVRRAKSLQDVDMYPLDKSREMRRVEARRYEQLVCDLQAELDKLSDEEHEVLWVKFVYSLTYEKMEEAGYGNHSTLNNRIRRLLEELRRILQEPATRV